jgi:hypothetical protein
VRSPISLKKNVNITTEKLLKRVVGLSWAYSDFDGLDQSILFESMSIELAIGEIYRNIDF